MQQWQYAMLRFDAVKRQYSINGLMSAVGQNETDMSVLDKLGTEGWEMVTAHFAQGYDSISVYLFKRPLAT
jgi:hypothetical protein